MATTTTDNEHPFHTAANSPLSALNNAANKLEVHPLSADNRPIIPVFSGAKYRNGLG